MSELRGASLDLKFERQLTDEGEVLWKKFALEGGQWTCAYRIAEQDGHPVLGELCIYPSDIRRKPWSSRPTAPPRGGITTRLLRKLSLGRHSAVVRGQIDEAASESPEGPGTGESSSVEDFNRELVRALGFQAPDDRGRGTTPRRRGPGRPGRPDTFYARIAERYVKELEEGNPHPTAAVASDSHYSQANVRDMVHEARARGLLSPAPRKGLPGGWLTVRARELLASERR